MNRTIEPGTKFVIIAEIIREVRHGERWKCGGKRIRLKNQLRNKYVAEVAGLKFLVCLDVIRGWDDEFDKAVRAAINYLKK